MYAQNFTWKFTPCKPKFCLNERDFFYLNFIEKIAELLFIMKNSNRGMTFIEILIVVTIIGLITAIAMPNLMKARSYAWKRTAYANLKRIDSAKHMWAAESNAANNAACIWSNIVSDYLRTKPISPGTYIIGTIDADPTVTGVSGVTLSGGIED